MKQTIFAVVVTYFPDPEKLVQLCRALAPEASVVVVDNTPDGQVLLAGDACTWISNGENLGIATAQNIGIRQALGQGAQAVAFFDQDSEVPAGLMPALRAALQASGAGVVVPVCTEAATGKEYPSFRLGRFGWPKRVYLGSSQEPVPVDLAISSGSLAASAVFDKAGLMDDGLFIDFVDFEWCARVRAAGFAILAVPQAAMRHTIGQFSVESAGLNLFVHSPVRCYYRVRNAFLLLRYRHVPFVYALRQVLAALVHHMLQWRHSEDPRLHLRMGAKGMKDGLLGRRGRLGNGGQA